MAQITINTRYIDVDYSSSGNIMTNKLNQLLEIKFCNSLLATLRLETPDFIRPLIGHVINGGEALNKKGGTSLPAVARMGWGDQTSPPPFITWPIRGLMKSGVSRRNVAKSELQNLISSNWFNLFVNQHQNSYFRETIMLIFHVKSESFFTQ